jgi:hypothetical protein
MHSWVFVRLLALSGALMILPARAEVLIGMAGR